MTFRVGKWLTEKELIQTGDTVVVGLSGGGDSVCLLHVMEELSASLGFSVTALHVHHGLRGESADADAAFCLKECERLGMPCRMEYADIRGIAARTGKSLEEAARNERYRLLEEERERLGARWICVAHHREDNAETILWNLFRGSGLAGLRGMQAVSGKILRPFLGVQDAKGAGICEEEIEAFLNDRGLTCRHDESNDTDEYTRNRIRHHILDYAAREINARADEHIFLAGQTAGEADVYLVHQAKKWLSEHAERTGAETKDEGAGVLIVLDIQALREEEKILQTYIIRTICAAYRGTGANPKDLSMRHVEAVLSLLAENPGGTARKEADLGNGLVCRRSYGQLIFERNRAVSEGMGEEDPGELCVTLAPDSTQVVHFGGKIFEISIFSPDNPKNFPTNLYTKWFDYDKIKHMFTFRTRRTGDYFLLPGGKRRMVKNWMIDEKIPAGVRDRMIVIAQDSHVLWIVGGRLSEGVKITDSTTTVLQIRQYTDED